MNLFKAVGTVLKWLVVVPLRYTAKLLMWGGRHLGRLSVKGGKYAWKRLRGEKGTAVVVRNKDGEYIGFELYDSNGKHVKTGTLLDLTSYYRKNFLNGVPEHIISTYRIDNIYPYMKWLNKPIQRASEALYRLTTDNLSDTSFSLREGYWRYKNDLTQGEMTPDQQMLFGFFNDQQDKLMERAELNRAIAKEDGDCVLQILEESKLSNDPEELKDRLVQCSEHAKQLFDFMDSKQLYEMLKYINHVEPSVSCWDHECYVKLLNMPYEQINTLQLFHCRIQDHCLVGRDGTAEVTKVVNRYDFNEGWKKDGPERFRNGNDKEKAEMISLAQQAGNNEAVQEMAKQFYMGMFNQNNIRSRQMYMQSVQELARVAVNTNDGVGMSPLMEYFYLVHRKNVACLELAEGMYTDRNFMVSENYSLLKADLESLNRQIDEIYATPAIISLEYQKVDKLVEMYRKGSIKGPDGKIQPDAAEALAGLIYSLHKVGVAEGVIERLANTDILKSAVLKDALLRHNLSQEDVQHYTSGQVRERTDARQQPGQYNLTSANGPVILQGTESNLLDRLELIHEKYGPMIRVDMEDRRVLPFPAEYVDDMMMREPETLKDIIRQVGAEALAYRNGDLTAEELFQCPCYEPYNPRTGNDVTSLADRMTEFWAERSMSPQEMAASVSGGISIPVSGSEELQFSADTPLDKSFSQTDEYIEKVDSMLQKYDPKSTFDQYCTLVCPSEKAVDMWQSKENQAVFVRLMDECVAMSMAYRKGEITPKELINAIPNAQRDNGYSKEYADKLSNRVMGIYEGRIRSSVQQLQDDASGEKRRVGYHR